MQVYRWVIAPMLPSSSQVPITHRRKKAGTTAAGFSKSLKKLLSQIDNQAERMKIHEVSSNTMTLSFNFDLVASQ